jgi:DNA-binding Lrp family transcriptional regulator
MDGWWDELDDEILGILKAGGPMETSRLAARLGMSADAVGSCLALLSAAGRVRICSAEVPFSPGVGAQAA